MPELPYELPRTVVIRARPATVFQFFTDSERWAKWWGPGSTIDANPGGRVYIRYPDGTEAVGEVVEVRAPERIVFTYGYAKGEPIAPGISRVSIHLEEHEAGTRLHLSHAFAEAAVRDQHVQGWRFQLSVFSNVVADEVYAHAAAVIDAWFEAWAIADDNSRGAAFEAIATSGIQFHDRYSALEGRDDLAAHAGAALRLMPGLKLQRKGAVRQCQGTVLAEWSAIDRNGQDRMSGASVFTFSPDLRIHSVTSFTKPVS